MIRHDGTCNAHPGRGEAHRRTAQEGGDVRQRVIGSRTFPTRKAAEEAVRSILTRTTPGQHLAGPDYDLVRALLGLHPQATEKIGAGVQAITTRRMEYGTRCFWIIRTDGSGTDFSFKVALDGAVDHPSTVRQAMRESVGGQIASFRRTWFSVMESPVCELSGLPLDPHGDTHVDHIEPQFVELADTFAKSQGGYDAIAVQSADGQTGASLTDPQQLAAWRDYHAEHARLRVVHPSANLSRPKRRKT